ncbi:MAG TPA: hypothetical protein VF267_03455, partial [Gammaproteobacteria bacterium]
MHALHRCFPLLLSALLASPAFAAELQGADDYWRVSTLLESQAMSATGEPLGDVEDIVFGGNGDIYAVLVNRDPATVTEDSEPVEDGTRRGIYEEVFMARFEGAKFDARENRLHLADMARRIAGDGSEPPPVGRYHASHVMGVPVNLADDERFGKVADILIRPGTTRAHAIVVEAGIFNNKEYFLPPEFSALDRDAREMNFAV